jgi:dipeptidase
MCDTIGVGPGLTTGGITIFGKNSDREPDEVQLVESIPALSHPEGTDLKCTYISIPQASSTLAAVLCRPFWMWGAEMGVNERGVAIGNEALFTKVKPEKKPGLIGMDLLRLALERSGSAEEAARVIIDLLSRYGQAGPCGYRDKKFSYMNSFLIADRSALLVLETVGRDHALKRHEGHAVISNAMTIAKGWDRSSLPTGNSLEKFADSFTTYFAGSERRRRHNESFILDAKGAIGPEDVFAMLRGHNGSTHSQGINRDVCMHASDPLVRRSQTTGSLVVELHPGDLFRIFVTAASAPCLTTFKPFLPASPVEDTARGTEHYSGESYWWRHEVLHIGALFSNQEARSLITDKARALESQWRRDMRPHAWNSRDDYLSECSRKAFVQSDELDRVMLGRMRRPLNNSIRPSALFWRHMARRTGVPLS